MTIIAVVVVVMCVCVCVCPQGHETSCPMWSLDSKDSWSTGLTSPTHTYIRSKHHTHTQTHTDTRKHMCAHEIHVHRNVCAHPRAQNTFTHMHAHIYTHTHVLPGRGEAPRAPSGGWGGSICDSKGPASVEWLCVPDWVCLPRVCLSAGVGVSGPRASVSGSRTQTGSPPPRRPPPPSSVLHHPVPTLPATGRGNLLFLAARG